MCHSGLVDQQTVFVTHSNTLQVLNKSGYQSKRPLFSLIYMAAGIKGGWTGDGIEQSQHTQDKWCLKWLDWTEGIKWIEAKNRTMREQMFPYLLAIMKANQEEILMKTEAKPDATLKECCNKNQLRKCE